MSSAKYMHSIVIREATTNISALRPGLSFEAYFAKSGESDLEKKLKRAMYVSALI